MLHVIEFLDGGHKFDRCVRAPRSRGAVGPIITCDYSEGVGSCAGLAVERLERVVGFGCAVGLTVCGVLALDGSESPCPLIRIDS